MTRAALYARYSSDLQSQASIEDQFRVCRGHAEHEGWTISGCYRDAAISGDSVILRPGVQALLEDARRGKFEVVVAEAARGVPSYRGHCKRCPEGCPGTLLLRLRQKPVRPPPLSFSAISITARLRPIVSTSSFFGIAA